MIEKLQVAYAAAALAFLFTVTRQALSDRKQRQIVNRSYRRGLIQLVRALLVSLERTAGVTSGVCRELDAFPPRPELDAQLADALVDIRIAVRSYEDGLVDANELKRTLTECDKKLE